MKRRLLFAGAAVLVALAQVSHLPAAPLSGKEVDVKQLGALGDGRTKDTAALQRAIDQAGKGGGTVRVPAGVYLSGALHLRSNMTLHLDQGAVLKATEDAADFPPENARWEGVETRAHSCLINGRDLENVAITGQGTIDGSGRIWWELVRAKKDGLKFPRPRLVEFIRCKKVRVEGVTLKDSPAWTLHPLYCEDVLVDGLKIVAPADAPNTDGIDPDSSRNVTITNCTIDVGDDCVVIKSGKDADGRRVGKPAENIVVTHCHMFHGHGGVVIGSETSGGVRNVRVSDCVFEGTDRGVRMKTQRGRGGVVENIRYENIVMKGVGDAVNITMFYHGKNDGKPSPIDEGTPTMGGVTVRNVTATDCKKAGLLEGLPERPLSEITLSNVTISAQKGFLARDVKGLLFQNVKLQIKDGPVMSKTRVDGVGLPE